MKKVFFVILVLLVCRPTYAANLPDFPFVVSVGSAELDIKPDQAVIHLNIVAFDKSSELAFGSVNKAVDSVMAIAKKYQINTDSIEASDLAKSTKRQRDSNHNRLEILGYEVSRLMTINLDEISQYSEIMSNLVTLDNIVRVNSEFDISNRNEIEAELIKKASKDAKFKAQEMASSLDSKLVSLYAVSQVSNLGQFFANFGASSQAQSSYDVRVFPSSSASSSTFVPKSIKISQGINVVFRIK